MNLLYGKRFSKDLDAIRNESNVRKRLLRLIEEIKKTNSLAEVKIKGIKGSNLLLTLGEKVKGKG